MVLNDAGKYGKVKEHEQKVIKEKRKVESIIECKSTTLRYLSASLIT